MKTTASRFRHLAAFVAISALALIGAQAQTTATTDPVGFLTIAIAGGGTASAPVYTFTALGLMNSIAFQSTTTSVGGDTTLVDANATWTDGLYNTNGSNPSHFVEIISGPGAGTQYDITGTIAATKTLNLGGPLLAGITGGSTYRIRPHWTIASVFGATNQNGLTSGTVTTADQIQLFRNGGYVNYYYKTTPPVAGGTGWRRTDDLFNDVSTTVIYPDEGVVIARKQSAAASLVINGAVKTGQTSIPVLTGYSLLGNVYATGMTLADSGIYTGNGATGVAAGVVTSADQVLIWNGSGYNTYYYKTTPPVAGGAGWRKTDDLFTDASATPLPVGSAVFIKRNGAPFNWVVPQHPVSFN